MASGLVVLCYDYAAGHKYITNAQNGYTVPLGDEKEFIASAAKIAQSQSAWIAVRQQARSTAETISWDAVIDGFASEIETYINPLNGHPPHE